MLGHINKKGIQQKIKKYFPSDHLKYINDQLSRIANVCFGATARVASAPMALCRSIREDVLAVRERDPAARSDLEVLLLYSGVHALIAHRIAHALYLRKCYFWARAISQISRAITGIEIHPGATIGKGFMIDHGMGVVIGETAEIGDNCTIYQGVTLGGTGKDVGKRHPTIGNDVLIGAGAKVLGPFNVGDGAKIAANAVVLEAIPENSTAVGIPARIVKRDNRRVAYDLDQVHIPDPVAQELCKLAIRISTLEKQLEEQKATAEKAPSEKKSVPRRKTKENQ